MNRFMKFQKINVEPVSITYKWIFLRPDETNIHENSLNLPTSDQLGLILIWNVLKYNVHGMIIIY